MFGVPMMICALRGILEDSSSSWPENARIVRETTTVESLTNLLKRLRILSESLKTAQPVGQKREGRGEAVSRPRRSGYLRPASDRGAISNSAYITENLGPYSSSELPEPLRSRPPKHRFVLLMRSNSRNRPQPRCRRKSGLQASKLTLTPWFCEGTINPIFGAAYITVTLGPALY